MFTGKPLPKLPEQSGIDLDGNHPPGAGQQMSGKRSTAGADLNYKGFRNGADGRGDTLQGCRTGKEMLSQSSSGHAGLQLPTLMLLRLNETKILLEVGRPNAVAGLKLVNRSLFSMLRLSSGFLIREGPSVIE